MCANWAIKNGWSARQLERQINSLLFDRLLKSRDKAGVLALANEGLVVNKPADAIKDPYVLEFLELPESHRLVESAVEAALLTQLQAFLLELGSDFAFIGRQVRLAARSQFICLWLRCSLLILHSMNRSGCAQGQPLLFIE